MHLRASVYTRSYKGPSPFWAYEKDRHKSLYSWVFHLETSFKSWSRKFSLYIEPRNAKDNRPNNIYIHILNKNWKTGNCEYIKILSIYRYNIFVYNCNENVLKMFSQLLIIMIEYIYQNLIDNFTYVRVRRKLPIRLFSVFINKVCIFSFMICISRAICSILFLYSA